ncbi:MAG TPA: DUF2892 domain-containing protein [Chitinophaga sp.]|uniref:YgaP family membrane protein n=1 Tax=Chitinophaga sp. TaxID=1869181 RepID=UPI002DBE4FD0|nr:DUF2892 domain-containing protein [Chitinophaga sp.]HEU4556167.1 DUF2892 domain-containing protein [Chitinophaga sp.]
MKKNMGVFDRIIRAIAAVFMGYLAYYNIVTGSWGVVLTILSIAFFITALVGVCPLYSLLHIRTLVRK